jgi:hypothetical protein
MTWRWARHGDRGGGLKPGKDITLVSIDAVREAVQAVAQRPFNCTVECNPLFRAERF